MALSCQGLGLTATRFLALVRCGTFSANAFQQHAGRFVVGVLRHEFAGEGGFEDVFALGGGLFQANSDRYLLLRKAAAAAKADWPTIRSRAFAHVQALEQKTLLDFAAHQAIALRKCLSL